MILWAIELSEFDVEYVPRKAIKAQVLVEMLAEFVEGECKELEAEIEGKREKSRRRQKIEMFGGYK